MKKPVFYILLLSLLICISCKEKNQDDIHYIIENSLDSAIKQSLLMAKVLEQYPDSLPRSIKPDGDLWLCNSHWWTSGFFPGTLWYLYEYSKSEEIKTLALQMTERVRDQQYTTDNHDVGFIINCSFGNAYRQTGDTAYRSVIVNAAKSLSTRFNPVVGCTKSWNRKTWQFPVIIDNMMNLELLCIATRISKEKQYRNIAVSHADKTMENHFRPDFSSYHVVSYDTITGKAVEHVTRQGYSDESSWSRGQAWAVYGYTMMYREIKNPDYLEQAKNIADFIINHPRLPEDGIPYWDFDAPDIPDTKRDASAGALIASALIELSTYVDKELSLKYINMADKQIRSLSSPEYTAAPGTNHNFILMHSVGFFGGPSELDVPLSYADYYYIEALVRYKKLLEKKSVV